MDVTVPVYRRRRLGLSYIELLMSLAVFCILLIPVFPTLSQAAHNAAAAREGYAAHLSAQEILLRVCGELRAGRDPTVYDFADTLHKSGLAFGFWLSSGEGYLSPNAPQINVTMSGTASDDGTLVTAVVWDSEGRMTGRATGWVPPRANHETS